MLKNIGAVVVGLFVGMAWNMGLVQLNTAFFPMPEGLDPNDSADMKTYIGTLPVQGFLLVLLAHAGQAGIGGWLAARMAQSRPAMLAWIICGLTVLGDIMVQIMFAGPAWMWIDVPLTILAGWAAVCLDAKRRAASA